MLSLLAISVLRPAVHRAPLPGPYRGGCERATTPQAIASQAFSKPACDLTSGELFKTLLRSGISWRDCVRLRLAGIDGKTLMAASKHEFLEWTGGSLNTACVLEQQVEQIMTKGASPPPPACKDDAPSPTPTRHVLACSRHCRGRNVYAAEPSRVQEHADSAWCIRSQEERRSERDGVQRLGHAHVWQRLHLRVRQG